MAIAQAPTRPTPSVRPAAVHAAAERPVPARPGARDTGIDLVRALCVVAVIALHGLQVGVTVDRSGPVLEYATVGAAWYPPLTWLLQVMPIFFVIGGFAGMLAYRRTREKGGTAVDFVVGRVHRLLVPAVLTIATAGIALAFLLSIGVPPDLVQQTGIRYGEPLWFLGVFLASQALLPALLVAHEKAPRATLIGLVTSAVLVDALRAVTGIDAIGYLNIAFVWLALQQAGFFLAEGRIDALSRRTRALGGLAAGMLLAGTVTAGVFSPDLIANLNPPTTALLLVGAAQTAVLSLLRDRITQLSIRPRVAAFTAFVTARTMTIYLWNLTALLTLAAISAFLAMNGALVLPEPSSLGWWLTRPVWLALAFLLTAAVGWALGGSERLRLPRPTTSARRAAQAVLLGLTGVLVLLLAGTTVLHVVIALAAILAALARIRAPRRPTPTSPVPVAQMDTVRTPTGHAE